jgi:hypothetical protein
MGFSSVTTYNLLQTHVRATPLFCVHISSTFEFILQRCMNYAFDKLLLSNKIIFFVNGARNQFRRKTDKWVLLTFFGRLQPMLCARQSLVRLATDSCLCSLQPWTADAGSKHLRNVGQHVQYHTAQYPGRLAPSCWPL